MAAKKRSVKKSQSETFAQWMRRERIAQGMTLNAAAALIGTSKSYVWEMENKVSEPGLLMALKIAAAFGRTLGSVLSELEME